MEIPFLQLHAIAFSLPANDYDPFLSYVLSNAMALTSNTLSILHAHSKSSILILSFTTTFLAWITMMKDAASQACTKPFLKATLC